MAHFAATGRMALALRLAEAAKREIRSRFQSVEARTKADGSLVTDADIAAEEAMRTLLAKEAGAENVFGEELGAGAPDLLKSGRWWVLDPIDGTQAFALGLPTFGSLIAYVEDGAPRIGVIALPALGFDVYAERGAGCFVHKYGADPAPARVRAPVRLDAAFVAATGLQGAAPAAVDGMRRMSALAQRARQFRFVGDCVQHAMVCIGGLDAAVDMIVAPWDVAALIPCVIESGGATSDAGGASGDPMLAGSVVSANSPALLREICAAL